MRILEDMNDDQLPPTAPGFRSLPIAPPSEGHATAPVPLRGAWSFRRRAATAIAALALVGTGGAVAAGSLAGDDDQGVDNVTPPAAPAQPGTASSDRSGEHREPGEGSGEEEESDEA